MNFLFLFASATISEATTFSVRFLWWSVVCFFIGRSVGKTIDIQYREAEGQPKLVKIPAHMKWLFYFRYLSGTEVVQEGLIAQVGGYIFSVLELIVFFLARVWGADELFVEIADWLIIVYAVILCIGILLPMSIRYEHNLQVAYDRDWVTRLQEVLTLYPKRRCKITAQVGPATYEIVLGRWGKKKRIAKASVPVDVGTHMYAVHSNEQGFPFWTIKNH